LLKGVLSLKMEASGVKREEMAWWLGRELFAKESFNLSTLVDTLLDVKVGYSREDEEGREEMDYYQIISLWAGLVNCACWSLRSLCAACSSPWSYELWTRLYCNSCPGIADAGSRASRPPAWSASPRIPRWGSSIPRGPAREGSPRTPWV